ncbi:outer membrane lipoprotein carrier protein LolA [Methylolobus aquaticus]|nr:outer membrane lipoprotein carrier protein LolA [Methylolobus aquaticus]
MAQPSRRLPLALALLSAASWAADPAPPRTWNLDALLGTLGTRVEGTARFSEIRTLKIVATPLRSSGRLSFRRPDILEKQLLVPRKETLRIDGDRLTIEDGSADSPRTVHLSDHPPLLAAIESIRAPLTGDAETLRRLFTATLGGSERRWVLTLVPRDAAYAEIVRVVYVHGSGPRIESIRIDEANGDRSEIRIEPEH